MRSKDKVGPGHIRLCRLELKSLLLVWISFYLSIGNSEIKTDTQLYDYIGVYACV